MNKIQFPLCMEYIGNNQYKCTQNKLPIITVLPENLPIRCNVCPLSRELALKYKQELEAKKAEEEYKLPGIAQLAKNFGVAVANHAMDGFKKVTYDEYNSRIIICNNCERFENGRCKHPKCGCFVAIKARWVSENCPEKKWPINE